MGIELPFITPYRDLLLLFLLVTTVIDLLLLLILIIRTTRLNRRYRQFMAGMEGKNLEDMLLENLKLVKAGFHRVEEVELICRRLEGITQRCIQGVGVVRFNAFEDVGSDLSFAVALLDQHGDGVVFSSLYGREDTRTYAKPVTGGQSSYLLTAEEKAAIKKALDTKATRR
ncbi:MAG: DUF4446 family protein [Firmicutes bacterium]|nr:DUF4446 family protein [Bacillota bacterium]